MLDSKHIDSFAETFRGELIQPADAGCDAARALYNGIIDKRRASSRAAPPRRTLSRR